MPAPALAEKPARPSCLMIVVPFAPSPLVAKTSSRRKAAGSGSRTDLAHPQRTCYTAPSRVAISAADRRSWGIV
jgi:hypothetical protein